jgi:hypothetical protein
MRKKFLILKGNIRIGNGPELDRNFVYGYRFNRTNRVYGFYRIYRTNRPYWLYRQYRDNRTYGFSIHYRNELR